MKFVPLWIMLSILLSCEQKNKPVTVTATEEKKTTVPAAIPEFRDNIKTTPVAEHTERTENPLNEWYFSVKLYETPKTFHYLIKLNFEEIRGEDTLKLPNFGIPPQPVIQKGNDKYSCIIGFMDKDNKFREYKKVYVKNNTLKITALKHYAVATYQREQEKK